jgi:hypothetical protein
VVCGFEFGGLLKFVVIVARPRPSAALPPRSHLRHSATHARMAPDAHQATDAHRHAVFQIRCGLLIYLEYRLGWGCLNYLFVFSILLLVSEHIFLSSLSLTILILSCSSPK